MAFGRRPVRSDERLGLHNGYWVYARSNLTPRAASLSMFGERTGAPYTPRSLFRSSAMRKSTLSRDAWACPEVHADAATDSATRQVISISGTNTSKGERAEGA